MSNSLDLITVFTPTYNRGNLLDQLYQSLLIQNNKNFEWLIVDDGSTDDTKKVIENYIKENKIKINYFYKENGGKHTAINLGVNKALGSLIFFVDSDDTLTINSLQTLIKEWTTIKNNLTINGIVGLFQDSNANIIGDKFDEDLDELSFSDIYYKYNIKGDKAVAFKTEVLKKYPFPEKKGIHFVFEAVVWHAMSKKYNVKCINLPLQIVSYQPNGLSDSNYKLWYIKGLAFSYYNLVENDVHPFFKYPKIAIQNYLYLVINSLLSEDNYYNQLKIRQKIIYIVVFPRALWAYFRMRKLVVK